MTAVTASSEGEATTESSQPVDRLRHTTTAVRLSFTWLGIRKTLTQTQKDQAAGSFGAQGRFLAAAKKLLDCNHPSYKSVTKVRGEATKYWKESTLPYPEPGLRLLRQADVAEFGRRVDRFKEELSFAVVDLEEHYDELRNAARERLGDLFNASDYPATLIGAFGLDCDFPGVEPPEYLKQLSPHIYAQECARVQTRFNEAVALAEQAFFDELARLVDHLAERLTVDEEGKQRVFRDSAVSNLNDFFTRFQRLNISSNGQLDELVQQAHCVIDGVQPQQLRDSQSLRQHVASQMAGIQSSLDQMLVDRPRRRIQRRPK